MYIPRSGALRKIKYALPIHQEEDFEEDVREELVRVAQKVKEDVTLEKGDDEKKDPARVSGEKKRSVARKSLHDVNNKRESPPSCVLISKNVNEFSFIPDEVFDRLYPENATLPPFPVLSCSDPFTSDSDGDESEYDMDSEDEMWLQDNPDYYLTPSRLEYIFTQLNKRNTHVKLTAIGALRPPYHEDFHKVFPYWKEKRLHNRNVSSWKQKKTCRRDARTYIQGSSEIFSAKACKATPHQKKSWRKSKEECEALVNRVISLKEKLLSIQSWARDTAFRGELDRQLIVKKFLDFKDGYSLISATEELQQPVSPDVDQNNNGNDLSNYEDIQERHMCNHKDNIPRSNFLGSLGTTRKNKQKFYPEHRKKGKKAKPKKSIRLEFEDVVNGKWRKASRTITRKRKISTKENLKPSSAATTTSTSTLVSQIQICNSKVKNGRYLRAIGVTTK